MFYELILLSSLLGLGLGCSCVEGSYNRPEGTAICDDFRSEDDIYTAVVQEIYCKCIVSDDIPEDFSCVKYDKAGATSNGETQETFNCQTQDIINNYRIWFKNCSVVNDFLLGRSAPSFDLTKTPVTNLTDEMNCGFGEDEFDVNRGSGCVLNAQPCYYMVNVTRVFKGDLIVGSVMSTAGPDVLTSCGNYGRVLKLGEEYVVGIGGACNPINEWTEVSGFTQTNLDLLNRASNDSQVCGSSAAVIARYSTVSVLLLVALLAIVL